MSKNTKRWSSIRALINTQNQTNIQINSQSFIALKKQNLKQNISVKSAFALLVLQDEP